MSRIVSGVCMTSTMTALIAAPPVHATPTCMLDIGAYKLAGDTMVWSMTIAPGADCIRGLRWSTMQIYNVSVAEKPKRGELVLVGPGFRYFAKPDFSGTDTFTLVVLGQNRHDAGASTVQVTISGPSAPVVISAVN